MMRGGGWRVRAGAPTARGGRAVWAAAWVAVMLAVWVEAAGAQARNLDFRVPDPGEPSLPAGWRVSGPGHDIRLDTLGRSGDYSLRMKGSDPGQMGLAIQTIPAELLPPPGSRIVLSGYIRTADVTGGYAGLLLRIEDRDQQLLFQDVMAGRGATGTGEWARYSVEVIVPRAAGRIQLGVHFPGTGTAWFDDLTLDVRESVVRMDGPRALTERGLANLVAFTRLLGYLRYFHPSDEAAAADWVQLAVAGARRVEEAEGPERLVAILDSIFRPVAPSVAVRTAPGAGAGPAGVGAVPTLEAAPGPRGAPPVEATEVVSWRHFGVGINEQSIYRSERISTPLDAGPLPDSIPDPRTPLVLPLIEGVEVVLPLAVYRDPAGTLPRPRDPVGGASSQASTAEGPDGPAAAASPSIPPPGPASAEFLSGDDRGTRLAVVALAWNLFQHFYPYFDVIERDWAAELPIALRSAAVDADRCQFRRTLQRLVAALDDGHGQVSGTCAAQPSRPQVAIDWVEDRLTVVHAPDPSFRLRRGDVILRIDGRTVGEVVREEEALISAATPQWRRWRSLPALLGGAAASSVELTVERIAGDTVALEVARAPGEVREPRNGTLEEIEPGIWYVALDRVEIEAFDRRVAELSRAAGVVFDLRGYPTSAAIDILRHLIKEPATSAQWHVPVVTSPDRAGMRFDHRPGWDLQPRQPFLDGHVVFLTDGRAISYAESVMGIVEAYDLGTIVGQPTAGTNGNVNPISLPGGYHLSWTGMKVLKHDGSRHHGIGIVPHLEVARTRAGVAEGRDEVLEAAIRLIRSREAPAEGRDPLMSLSPGR